MIQTVHILGAGMSGLVVGHEFAKKGYKVRLIERMSIPGGLARTERFDAYYVDSGPHLFHTSNQDIVQYWDREFPGEFLRPELFGRNFVDGRTYEYPISEASLRDYPENVKRKIQEELERRDPDKLRTARNYHEYMTALAGETLRDHFFTEYPEKLWGMSTHQLSANWAPRRLEIRKEKLPFHANQWTGVAKHGCGRIMEILAEKISARGGTICYNTIVEGLDVSGRAIHAIRTQDGPVQIGTSDIVISTLPITVLARFLEIPCALSYRTVKLVNLVLRRDDRLFTEADWLYFKDKSLIFHRVGVQTRFSRIGISDDLSILCAEIAMDSGDEKDRMTEEAMTARVIQDLERTKLIRSSDVIKTHFMNLGPVYPSYRVGYEEELQSVKARLETYDNLHFTGTLAEFSYADFQVLCAKSIDLVQVLTDPGSRYNHVQKATRRIEQFAQRIQIGRFVVADDQPPFVIAEIGLNHNGNFELAKRLIDMSVRAGCHAVKFQTFTKERISSKVLNARYNEDILGEEENLSQLFSRLIFSRDELEHLFDHARRQGVEAFSTPFDTESVDLLESLGVSVYKISSMDLVNLPLIERVARTMKPLIMSTGMSTLGDIEEALAVVAAVGNPNLVLLHCISSYPCPVGEVNLRAIPTLRNALGTLVGFSDHFPDTHLVPASIALGARVIEKHVTLDRQMEGPDHCFSVTEPMLKRMNTELADVSQALGSGRKSISPSEVQTVKTLRRSLFARTDIPEGTKITEDMLAIRSPGVGLVPKYRDIVVGRVARRTIPADHPITWESI